MYQSHHAHLNITPPCRNDNVNDQQAKVAYNYKNTKEKLYKTNAAIYLFIYLLTPWSRVLLEKITASQLVKKFIAF